MAHPNTAMLASSPMSRTLPSNLFGCAVAGGICAILLDDLDDDGLLNDLHYDTSSKIPEQGRSVSSIRLPQARIRVYRFVLSWYFQSHKYVANADIGQNSQSLCQTICWIMGSRTYVLANCHASSAKRANSTTLFDTTLPERGGRGLREHRTDAQQHLFLAGRWPFLRLGRLFRRRGSCPATAPTSGATPTRSLTCSRRSNARCAGSNSTSKPSRTATWLSHLQVIQQAFSGRGATGSPKRGRWANGQHPARLPRMAAQRRPRLAESIWPEFKRAHRLCRRTVGTDGDGVLEGKQHNTYDIEFYGPNPLCSIYYLAALRAVGNGVVLGERQLPQHCRESFERAAASSMRFCGTANTMSRSWTTLTPITTSMAWAACRINCSGSFTPACSVSAICCRRIISVRPSNRSSTAISATIFATTSTASAPTSSTTRPACCFAAGPTADAPRFPFVYSDEVWTGIEYQVAAD